VNNIKRLPMPNDLRQMELKIANGADPDEIKGVERLWLYRQNCLLEEFGRSEREFFEWLANQQIKEAP
jgi:hypothetical protein